jgi:protein-tyrosine-phosphatase
MTYQPLNKRPLHNVLFGCEDNARYSLIAEALFRDGAISGMRSFSAGLRPADAADPFTLSALALSGLGADGLWPKHWDGFCLPNMRLIDTIVIFGEETAVRLPRVFPGRPRYLVWPMNKLSDNQKLHQGVWRDIQRIRPFISCLIDELIARQGESSIGLAPAVFPGE